MCVIVTHVTKKGRVRPKDLSDMQAILPPEADISVETDIAFDRYTLDIRTP